MSNLKPIAKKPVQDEVFDQLKANIVSGNWKPGTRLPSEERLSKTLSVSRITIRAALHRLSALGLIESRHGDGTFVKHYSPENHLDSLVSLIVLDRRDILELLEIRQILEVAIAGLVAQRITDGQLKVLKSSFERMKTHSDDVEASANLDTEFHLYLADAAGNSIIRKIFMLISDVYESGMRGIKKIMGSGDALHYHALIVEAIEARNPERARKVMAEHIERTISAVKEHIEEFSD